MIKLFKKYCMEICLLLIVVILLLRTSRILERFQESIHGDVAESAAEEERLRLMEIAGTVNI